MEDLDEVILPANFGTWFALERLRSGACILALAFSLCALRSKLIRIMAGGSRANWAKVLPDIV
jgi:hypothetical protein